MKTIVLHPNIVNVESFREAISSQISGFAVEILSDSVNPDAVEIVVIWLEVMDCIRNFRNLKLILVCGSGVDTVINMVSLPQNIPLVRVVDRTLQTMYLIML